MQRLCLITGGNGGIGYGVATQLLAQGHRVLLACRDPQKGQAAVSALQKAAPKGLDGSPAAVEMVLLDLASFASVRRCAAQLVSHHPRLDVLICNAAIVPQGLQHSVDGHELAYQTNHLSHFLLVSLLVRALQASDAARVVVVASELHARGLGSLPPSPSYFAQFDRHSSGSKAGGEGPATNGAAPFKPMEAYSLTKLYNLWFAFHLAKLLPPNVTCNAVTPGFVPSTNLSRGTSWIGRLGMRYVMPLLPFATSEFEGARRVTDVAAGDIAKGLTGRYFSKGVEAASSAESKDVAKAEELWQISLTATGLTEFLPHLEGASEVTAL